MYRRGSPRILEDHPEILKVFPGVVDVYPAVRIIGPESFELTLQYEHLGVLPAYSMLPCIKKNLILNTW
jgi:hypothetical protein